MKTVIFRSDDSGHTWKEGTRIPGPFLFMGHGFGFDRRVGRLHVERFVAALMGEPGLLAWYTYDERNWGGLSPVLMTETA